MSHKPYPMPAAKLTYRFVTPYGPFSAKELAVALERNLIDGTDAAQILEDQLDAENRPFETWQIIERLRASDGSDRAAIVHDLIELSSGAGNPLWRWILLLAKEALQRYDDDKDIIAVLDQLWGDYERPLEFRPYTAIGNVTESRRIVDEDDLRLLAESTPDKAASRAIVTAVRQLLDRELESRRRS